MIFPSQNDLNGALYVGVCQIFIKFMNTLISVYPYLNKCLPLP